MLLFLGLYPGVERGSHILDIPELLMQKEQNSHLSDGPENIINHRPTAP